MRRDRPMPPIIRHECDQKPGGTGRSRSSDVVGVGAVGVTPPGAQVGEQRDVDGAFHEVEVGCGGGWAQVTADSGRGGRTRFDGVECAVGGGRSRIRQFADRLRSHRRGTRGPPVARSGDRCGIGWVARRRFAGWTTPGHPRFPPSRGGPGRHGTPVHRPHPRRVAMLTAAPRRRGCRPGRPSDPRMLVRRARVGPGGDSVVRVTPPPGSGF